MDVFNRQFNLLATKFFLLLSSQCAYGISELPHVELYGRMHVSLEDFKSGYSNVERDIQLRNNLSRFGLRGKENLGSNINAIFQIESNININGTGTLASRDTFIGLASKHGTVKLGNFYGPYDDLHYIAGNSFQYFSGSSNDAALWANGSSFANGGFDQRTGQSISYDTPRVNNVSGRIQYSNITAVNNNDNFVIQGNIRYDDGIIRAAAAHIETRRMLAFSSNFYQKSASTMVAGGYKFQKFYIAGLLENSHWSNINLTGSDRTRFYWSALGQYTFNNNHIFSLFYGQAQAYKGEAGINNSGAKMSTLAYNYVMSPKTQIYILSSHLDNEFNAPYILGGNPARSSGALGDYQPGAENQQTLAIGLWHNF